MDYRSYENKVNETKNDIISFLALKTNKTHEYATSIVDSYFDLLNKGDISIKSFKLKILHSDHANEKNTLEFSEVLNNKFEELNDFLETFFQDYEKNLKSYKFFPTRKSDLSQLNYPLKRKKQENVTRISNYERDLALKTKDINAQIGDKKKTYLQSVNEINRRLSIDLQRNVENCSKEYLPLERSLLDIDDKEKIKEIRSKIKEIRGKSLESQYQLKTKSYGHLKEDELKHYEEVNKAAFELELLKEDYKKKILLANRDISLLQLEESNNVFQYDYQKDVQSMDIFSHNLESYLNIISVINEKVLKEEDSNNTEFMELRLNKKILECMLRYYKINFYDPAIRMINRIASFYGDVKEFFGKEISLMNEEKNKYSEEILNKINEFEEKVFKTKKTNKSEFEDNIKVGLENLYSSKHFDLQYTNFLDFVNRLITLINEKVTRINSIVEEESLKLVLSQRNRDELPIIEENIESVKSRFGLYKNNYLAERSLEKDEFESKSKKETQRVERKYALDLELIEKNIKDITKKDKINTEKELSRIEKEYHKNCKVALKDLKHWKRIL